MARQPCITSGMLLHLEEEGKTLVLNGLQTTPATLNIVPNAHGTWFSICPCDLIWTLVRVTRAGAARSVSPKGETLKTVQRRAVPINLVGLRFLLINRYCSSLNRPPRLRFAKAPRLTQAGNGSINSVTTRLLCSSHFYTTRDNDIPQHESR